MRNIAFIIAMFFILALLSGTALAEVNTEYETGLKYYNSGQYEEAVRVFKNYVEKKPIASAYYRIGYALYKLGKHDEAMEYFDDAYLVDPDFSPVPVEKQPVKEIRAEMPGVTIEEPQVPVFAAEEPVIQRQQVALEEGPVEEIQPEALQVPAVAPEEPVAREQVAVPAEEPQPKVEFQMPPGFPSEEPVPFEKPRIPTGLVAVMAGFMIFFQIFQIVSILFFLLCLFLIAKKLDVPNAWLAWIPIVNLWTFVTAAGKSWWWILLTIFTFGLAGIYLWMCITENLGKNKWLGLLVIPPVINLIFLGFLAFSKSESEGEAAATAV